MIGIIILILVGLIFLVMLGFVVFKIIKGPNLPPGNKFSSNILNKDITIIVQKDIPSIKNKDTNKIEAFVISGKKIFLENLIKKCANALISTEEIFKESGFKNASRKQIIFFFKKDKSFETGQQSWWESWAKHVAAYTVELVGFFGTKRVDMAVMREEYMNTIIEKGQPAIHELVHILNKASTGNYSSDHTDPKLWIGPGGTSSIEAKSVTRWKNNRT